MKKLIYFLIAFVLLGITGCTCSRQHIADGDLVIINDGVLSFYDASTGELTPFKAETDSVVNMLFTDRDHLYYSAANNQKLSLKMLDLSAPDPQPVFCADWNLTVEDATDYMFGKVSDIFSDIEGKYILIFGMDLDEGYMVTYVYEFSTGTVRKLSDDESYAVNLRDNRLDDSHSFSEDHLFYYVTPKGKACLNDKIDFAQYFLDEDERQDLEFSLETMSPDGTKVVYSAVVYWGEGWGFYCKANVDGSEQCLLDGSDVWHGYPQWLADGSLVYVGEAPLPESDPRYEEDYITTQPCIKLIDPQGNTKTISLGQKFVIRPFATDNAPKAEAKTMVLEGCDVALFDNGKVTFYNNETKEFVPFDVETDSVINGVFLEDYSFYYTVKIGEELYLKNIYMSTYNTAPVMVTDWGLKIDDCVSQTYGKASPLVCLPSYYRVGINYNFSWDFYNFADIKFYDYSERKKLNGWSEDEETETDLFDDDFLQYEEDMESFMTFEGNYYYLSEEDPICVSNKINFRDYVSDPSYFEGPEYVFYSIDPTRTMVAYSALIEWGDLGHGPLCVASLDGEMQIAIKDTDASDLSYGWLNDGSLLYVGSEPRPTDDPEYDPEWNTTKPCVRIIRPDGTDEVFSHCTDFVVRKQ